MAARHQLVVDLNFLDLPNRVRPNLVFQHHHVARLARRGIRFRRHINPKACRSVVTCSLALSEPLGITSPMLCGAPSGVMAHSVYVRYSRPKRVGGARCATLTSISVRPRFDSTVASPLASGMRTVPRKSITVGPDRS